MLFNFDPEDLDIVAQERERGHDRPFRAYAPSKDQKIRSFTICCLVLNRMIGMLPRSALSSTENLTERITGSGIFVTPGKVLKGTGSVGISMILWAIGAVVCMCALLVWLEFGLSIPREYVGGRERGVPRSGGEKNFVSSLKSFILYCLKDLEHQDQGPTLNGVDNRGFHYHSILCN